MQPGGLKFKPVFPQDITQYIEREKKKIIPSVFRGLCYFSPKPAKSGASLCLCAGREKKSHFTVFSLHDYSADPSRSFNYSISRRFQDSSRVPVKWSKPRQGESHRGSHSADDQLRRGRKVQPEVGKLTKNVNHAFCQDARTQNRCVGVRARTHTHTRARAHTYMEDISSVVVFARRVFCQPAIRKCRARGGSDKSKRWQIGVTAEAFWGAAGKRKVEDAGYLTSCLGTISYSSSSFWGFTQLCCSLYSTRRNCGTIFPIFKTSSQMKKLLFALTALIRFLFLFWFLLFRVLQDSNDILLDHCSKWCGKQSQLRFCARVTKWSVKWLKWQLLSWQLIRLKT